MWRAAKSRRSYCRSRLRDDEPQRPVKAVERAQVPVLRVPGAAREVVGEAGDYAVLDARLEQGPDGLRGADGGIEEFLGTRPVGLKKPVFAVRGNGDRLDVCIATQRLGDVLQSMKRHSEAADAYGRAAALVQAQKLDGELWSLLLLRASALEDANRWPEARANLQQALTLAPDQPLLLNFLGYGKLERGEDLDAAEAMIRKASELAPDEASIIDSLGWAEFKRGKVDDAIATLQRAAGKDPAQAEIQEHLGDALYRSGRRYEARFAWRAALVTAEDDVATRVNAKLASGLTPADAAP